MINKVSVSYLYVEPRLMDDQMRINSFYVFNLVQNGKGKLIFAERKVEGVFVLVEDLSSEHLQCVGGLIDFEHVDYTLYLKEVFNRLEEGHANYELEMMTTTLVKLLTEESKGEVKSLDFLTLLLKNKVVNIYPTVVSLDVFRRKNIIHQIKKAFPYSGNSITSQDLILLINQKAVKNSVVDDVSVQDHTFYSCSSISNQKSYRMSLIASDNIQNVA